MGNFYQTLAFQTLKPNETEAVAGRLLDWLLAEGYILPGLSDCVLSADIGYPPGPNAPRATEMPDDRQLFELRTNGLVIMRERTVFNSDGVPELICPKCGWDNGREETNAWVDAVSAWHDGDDEAALMCDGCGYEAPIKDWPFEPAWAFGHLGFQFHNWNPFAQDFLQQAERAAGAPIILVYGKF